MSKRNKNKQKQTKTNKEVIDGMKKVSFALERGTIMVISALTISLIPALPAFAKDKSVSSVMIRVNAVEDDEHDTFQVGAYMADSAVDVTVPNSDRKKYHIAGYSFNNSSREYFSTHQAPTLKIKLEAEEDYKFKVDSVRDVKLSGNAKPVYKSFEKNKDGTILEVETVLSDIEGNVGDIEYAGWDVNRSGTLDVLTYGGNSCQIQLYKDGEKYSSAITIPDCGSGNHTIDMRPYIKNAGNYTFSARQYNADTHSRGAWYTVDDEYRVDEGSAAENRSQYGYICRDCYGWKKDGSGWKFLTPGGCPKDTWVEDNHHWFWIDGEGYMVTGWRLIDGKWYYFNDRGEMLENTTTPDGYAVGADGALLQ
jgi:glucan-binding YG repeat protein